MAKSIKEAQNKRKRDDLRQKPNKSAIEIRLLELLNDSGTIDYADQIVVLEFKENRTPIESRLLELLTQPSPARIPRMNAKKIVELEFKAHRTAQESRKLELLLDRGTTEYAEDIVALESKPTKTAEESRRLELYNDPLNRRQARDIAAMEFNPNRTLSEIHRLENFYLSKAFNPSQSACQITMITDGNILPNCRTQAAHPERISLFRPADPNTNYRFLLLTINRTAENIISHYLSHHRVPVKLRESEEIQKYISDKKDMLRLAFLKFYSLDNAPRFDMDNFKLLIHLLKQKITNNEVSLHDQEKFMELHKWTYDANEQEPLLVSFNF